MTDIGNIRVPKSKVKIVKEAEGEDASSLGNEQEQAPIKKTDTPSVPDKSNDFVQIMGNIVSGIPFKMSIIIFIIFVLINSTIFIEYCIEPLGKRYYDTEGVTNAGTYLQGLFLVIGYMLMYGLISTGLI